MSAIIFYSTTDGHTQSIAQKMAAEWEGAIQVLPIERLTEFVHDSDIKQVVIGASIRYGHFQPSAVKLIKDHVQWLGNIQSAFFSVNLTARKPGKNDPAASPYIQKFLHKTDWVPDQIAMFAGKLEYPKYGFFDKQMIRLIMNITGGCADGKSIIDYTNWDEVTRFAKTVSKLAEPVFNG